MEDEPKKFYLNENTYYIVARLKLIDAKDYNAKNESKRVENSSIHLTSIDTG